MGRVSANTGKMMPGSCTSAFPFRPRLRGRVDFGGGAFKGDGTDGEHSVNKAQELHIEPHMRPGLVR